MNKFLNWLRETDLITLSLEIGLAVYILVSFTRCAFKD